MTYTNKDGHVLFDDTFLQVLKAAENENTFKGG